MTIRKLREKVDQVNQIHAAFLPSVSVNLSHLDSMVAASRQVVTRWMVTAYDVTSSTNALANAWNRVNQNISPSRQGKDSMKDCVVLETYLAAMDELRAARLVQKAVFLSSNTREYLSESRVLKADLVADFARVGSDYAPNMSAAKAALGL